MRARIMGLLAVGLLAGPMAANSAPMDFSYEFTATSFGAGFVTGVQAPDDTVMGSFGFTTDPMTLTSTGIDIAPSFVNLSISGFAYTTSNTLVQIVNDGFQDFPITILFYAIPDTGFAFQGNDDFFLAFRIGLSGDLWPLNAPLFAYTTQSIDDGWLAETTTVRRISTSVPEPGTLALLGLGLTGLALSRKRKAA